MRVTTDLIRSAGALYTFQPPHKRHSLKFLHHLEFRFQNSAD